MIPSETPTAAEVRDHLARVLASGPLANAGRLSRLLTYVVERTLAGEGDQLKEYVLGTEVFDRPSQYDPRLDSIVRVEARRLRAKLEEYYQGAGAQDAVLIDIPRGSYVPTFRYAAAPAAAALVAAPEVPPVRSTPSLRFLVVGAFLAGIISVIIFAGLQSRPGSSTAPQASSGPSLAVLPFEHYSTRQEDAQIAGRITDGLTTELARLGTVSVASRTSAARFTGDMKDVRTIAGALSVEFVLESSAVVESDTITVQTRLVDGLIDRKVWVGEYRSTPEDIPRLIDRMAADISAAAIKRKAAR